MSISIGGYLLFIYLFIYLFHFCFLVTHRSFADFIGDNIVLLPTYNSSANKLFDKPFVVVVVDCKTVGFFLKISKEVGNAWRKSLMRANRASLTPQSRSLFSASFHTFCLTARAYLNTQKYGLFCSLLLLLLV